MNHLDRSNMNNIELNLENVSIEEFIDGQLKTDEMPEEEQPEEEKPGEEIIPPVEEEEEKDSIPAEKEDTTVVEGVIPNAGKNILIICIFKLIVLEKMMKVW